MRFGTVAVPVHSLVTPGANPAQLASELLTISHASLARRTAERGFQTLEINTDLGFWVPGLFQPRAIRRLNQLKHHMDLSYTVHLPFWSLELSSPDDNVRAAAVKTTVEYIQKTLPLEPEVFVFHGTGSMASDFHMMGLTGIKRTLILDQFQKAASKSIKKILKKSGIWNRRLAIENIDFPFSRTWALAEQHDLSFTFDVGHCLAGFSDDDREHHYSVAEVFDTVLPRLAEIHLHDSPNASLAAPAWDQDHVALGHGDLDVKALLGRIADSGWDGPIVLELMDINEALESMALINGILTPQPESMRVVA